jgi:YD repeat-containing protein
LAVDYRRDVLYVLTSGNTILACDADGRMTARTDSASQTAVMAYHGDRLIVMKGVDLSIIDLSGASEPVPAPDSMTTIVDIFYPDLRREAGIESHAKGTNFIFSFDTSERGGFNIFATSSNNILSDNGETLWVKEGRSDSVFLFRSEGVLEPACLLDFGKYTPPAEAFGTNPKVALDRYYLTRDLWHSDRYTLVSVKRADFNGPEGFLVFDDRQPPGGFSAVGPDGESGFFIGGVAFTPKYIRDNRLVGYVQALDIVDNADAITNPDLKSLAATLREDSNPVLTVVKLK